MFLPFRLGNPTPSLLLGNFQMPQVLREQGPVPRGSHTGRLHDFARAAVTKYRRRGQVALATEIYCLTALEARSPRSSYGKIGAF